MALKKIIENVSGMVKEFFVEVTPEPDSSKKAKQRHAIQENVFTDISQSVSHNAKANTLNTALILALFDVLTQESLDAMPPEIKGLIEHLSLKFRNSTTRADVLLAEIGTDFIDHLIDTQVAVNDAIESAK